MLGRGTVEEDDPVTREAPEVLWKDPGNGEPDTHSDAPPAANEPVVGLAGSEPRRTEEEFASGGRRSRGQTGGAPLRQGSRMAA